MPVLEREAVEESGASAMSTRTVSVPGWRAKLELGLKFGDRGTRLYLSRHEGPLYVQKPFYPEGPDCAHLYLLHPPGGLVSGDELSIQLKLKPGAQALVTTPGAAKMYRAREHNPEQRQFTQLSVEEGGSLEWFPNESIVYNGAHATLDTRVDLTAKSFFCAWEMTCLGLPASKQAFTSGRFQQRYRIFVDGMPRFVDRLLIDKQGVDLTSSRAGLQGQDVNGFLLAGPVSTLNDGDAGRHEGEFDQPSPVLSDLLNAMRQCVDDQGMRKLLAITVVNDFIVARYLGASTREAREMFLLLWALLRPVFLQRKATPPRIWFT